MITIGFVYRLVHQQISVKMILNNQHFSWPPENRLIRADSLIMKIFTSVVVCLQVVFPQIQLIHSANPQSRLVGIIVFAHVVHTSVRTSPVFNIAKQNKAKTMFVTGETVGLAEWILDVTCLDFFFTPSATLIKKGFLCYVAECSKCFFTNSSKFRLTSICHM